MDMVALLLKKAQLETILDTIELLYKLHTTAPALEKKEIDEMIHRLTTMSRSLE